MTASPTIRFEQGPFSRETTMRWRAFLQDQPGSNFFQSPDYVELYDKCLAYKPVVLFAEEASGSLVALLVALIISDRVYGFPFRRMLVQGGPVVAHFYPNKAEILGCLLQNLREHIPGKTVFVEIRNLTLWDELGVVFQNHGFIWHDHLNDLLPVSERAITLSRIKPARQRQIRRGISNGAEIRPAGSVEEVEAFYHLLKELYRRKVRKPLAPKELFVSFYEKIQHENKGVLLLVIYKEVVIGGMVCPFSGDHTLHEWYICSRQDHLKHLYPGVLATWGGIDYAMNHHFKYFDFMGIGIPGKPYGVRDFKTRFGGEVVNFGRWQLISNPLRYKLGLLGYKLLQFIPKSRRIR